MLLPHLHPLAPCPMTTKQTVRMQSRQSCGRWMHRAVVAPSSRARTRKSPRIATRYNTAVANIGKGRRNPAPPPPKIVRWMSRMSRVSWTYPPLSWLRPRTRRMATHLHLRGQGNFLWPDLSGQGGDAGGITQGWGRSAAAGYVASAHTAARDGLFDDVYFPAARGVRSSKTA